MPQSRAAGAAPGTECLGFRVYVLDLGIRVLGLLVGLQRKQDYYAILIVFPDLGAWAR